MDERAFKVRLKLNAVAFVIATAGTLCFPQVLNLKENVLGFTNSIFAVFVWVLCIYAVRGSLHTIDWHDRRGWLIGGILSFLFTTAMLFGVRLDAVGNVDFKDWRLWISLPVLTCLFTILVRKFWDFLSGIEERKNRLAEHIRLPATPIKAVKYADLLIFLFLLLSWLPVLLAVYPGFFVYDAQEEWLQVASRNFTTHHPLVHVLLLGGIICAVHKVTDSYNLLYGGADGDRVRMLYLAAYFYEKKEGCQGSADRIAALFRIFSRYCDVHTLLREGYALYVGAFDAYAGAAGSGQRPGSFFCILEKDGFLCSKRPGDDAVS